MNLEQLGPQHARSFIVNPSLTANPPPPLLGRVCNTAAHDVCMQQWHLRSPARESFSALLPGTHDRSSAPTTQGLCCASLLHAVAARRLVSGRRQPGLRDRLRALVTRGESCAEALRWKELRFSTANNVGGTWVTRGMEYSCVISSFRSCSTLCADRWEPLCAQVRARFLLIIASVDCAPLVRADAVGLGFHYVESAFAGLGA